MFASPSANSMMKRMSVNCQRSMKKRVIACMARLSSS
jgi:hypothetical protein